MLFLGTALQNLTKTTAASWIDYASQDPKVLQDLKVTHRIPIPGSARRSRRALIQCSRLRLCSSFEKCSKFVEELIASETSSL